MAVGGGGVSALFFIPPIIPGDIASWLESGVLQDGGTGGGGGRTVLLTATDFFISHDTGNDANNGTVGSPWATLQHAVNFIASSIDINNQTITLHVADSVSTYAGVSLRPFLGGGNLVFLGNNITLGNVKIGDAVANGGSFFSGEGTGGTLIWVSGFEFVPTSGPALDFDGADRGSIVMGEPTFLLPTKNKFSSCQNNGSVMIGNIFDETLGTSIIDGTAINTHNPQAFYSSINGNTQTAFFFCPDFSITGTVTFSVAFVIVSAGAANFSGSFGGAGVVHGKRFQVEAGGTLHATSLTSLPGDLPGTNYGGELAVGSDDYMGPWPTSKSLQTPVAGFSITIADNIGLLILTPAGTLGTGTITTPANPIDQQTLTITSTQTISVLTVSPNAGQSVSGNPATLAANGAITAHYNASNTTWYMSTSSVSGGGGGTIGGAVGGGTVGSVLFVGAGSTLAQDNAEFFWDDTSFILKIAGELDFQSASALFKVSGTDRLDYAVTTAGRWTAFGDIALDSSNHRYFIGSAVAITVVPNVSGNNWFEGAAGNTSLTGYGNFGTGDLALSSITTGFLNVAVGRNAMQNSLDAFENIALGTQSLHFTQSDSSNIAIGFNALETLGNGGAGGGNNVQNVSVGFGALGNVSIAFGNVVIGANGLSNIAAPTTAIQNVVIGQSAGNNLGVGGGASVETNTLIGTNCALNLFGASSKNTWIGGFQGPSLALNNTIAIGTGTIAAELLDLNLSTTHIWTFGAVQSGQTPTGLHVYNIQDTNSLGLSSLIINYERAVFDWTNTSNVLVIGTQAAGTGSTRNLKFIIGGINKQDYGITNAGVWTVAQTTMVATSLTLTDGSSTSVATLTNGPATGNPTKWVPINDNGTTRYIPAW